jgi:glycosyltransferase involved in cell wall biosynthesis
MRILICTGIYPPDVGGPAKYAKHLEIEFITKGHQAKVLSYKIEKKLPVILRHFIYFLKVCFNLKNVDFIIGLDLVSTGFPSVLAARIFHKKIVVRIGGDFLWETYVEKTGNLITLEDFYGKMPPLPLKHKIIYLLQKFTIENSSAISFNSFWQRKIFEKVYKMNQNKVFVVENFYGPKITEEEPKKKNFLFAGRQIKFKNLKIIEEIFDELKKEGSNIKLDIISNLKEEELREKIRGCYALIVPSITDFAPNFIIEGLAFNKPFILTRNCGLHEKLKEIGIFVDPFNKEDIKNKILFLADEKNYQEYKKRVKNFNFTHSWQEIANEFINILTTLTTK